MSIWIELHCDIRSDGPTNLIRSRTTPFCYSNNTLSPGGLCENDRDSTIRLLRHLEKKAKDGGWKNTRKGWVCPNCAKMPPFAD